MDLVAKGAREGGNGILNKYDVFLENFLKNQYHKTKGKKKPLEHTMKF
jgi:hypothetical protein